MCFSGWAREEQPLNAESDNEDRQDTDEMLRTHRPNPELIRRAGAPIELPPIVGLVGRHARSVPGIKNFMFAAFTVAALDAPA